MCVVAYALGVGKRQALEPCSFQVIGPCYYIIANQINGDGTLPQREIVKIGTIMVYF